MLKSKLTVAPIMFLMLSSLSAMIYINPAYSQSSTTTELVHAGEGNATNVVMHLYLTLLKSNLVIASYGIIRLPSQNHILLLFLRTMNILQRLPHHSKYLIQQNFNL